MEWTLAATGAGTFVAAVAYAALAAMLARRPGSPGARHALRAFALYWALVSAFQILVSVQHALAAAGLVDFGFAIFVRYAGIALASLAIAGLLSFFAYIITGARRWTRWIVAVYVIVAALAWVHVYVSEPVGIARTAWSIDVAYANDFQGGLFAPLMLMLLGLPIAGAIWYLTLVRKATDARQRYRILAVGIGVGLQLLSFLLARIFETAPTELLSRVVLGVVVAGLVASAYFPRDRSVGKRRQLAHSP